MKQIAQVLLLLALLPLAGFAQVELGPSIGIGELPGDDDPICDIPLAMQNFNAVGPEVGELIPDFNLFDADGNEMVMSELLDEGKPVLMVAGSYTCWVFRNKIDIINQIVAEHGDDLNVIIVYTLEAHPVQDISPYYGFVNPGNLNLSLGITYHQHIDYGERKQVLAEMLDEYDVQADIYIDGPCNNWWETFGPAPNNAYLIDTDGIVLSKHGWFDKHPEDIFCDLTNYLDFDTDCGSGTGFGGYFTIETPNGTTAEGEAGTTVSIKAKLINDSPEGVEIQIERIDQDTPADWGNAICTDVCYPPNTESTLVYMEAGEELDYIHYFYTGPDPGIGEVTMRFTNTADPENSERVTFQASTYATTAAGDLPLAVEALNLYPNPAVAGTSLYIDLDGHSEMDFRLLDAAGRQVLTKVISAANPSLQPGILNSGLYFYQARTQSGKYYTGKLIIK